MKILRTLAFIALLAPLACAGDLGLMGPAGADGQDGQDGQDGTLYSTQLTLIDTDGTASITLPEGSGGIGAPPLVACYVGWSQIGPWLVISNAVPSCVIDGSLAGPLVASLSGAELSKHRYFRVTTIYRAPRG